MKEVSFFVGGFPVLSETFILNQIADLIKAGFDVKIFSMTREDSGVNHPWVKSFNLLERVTPVFKFKSKIGKICNIFFSIILDLFSLNFKRLFVIKKVGFIDYMVARSFEDVSGIVICHFGPIGSRLAVLLENNVLDNIKIYTFFHGYDLSVYSELEKNKTKYESLFHHGCLMLPISYYWVPKLIELGCSESKIHVHRMGVDVDSFKFVSRYENDNNQVINLITVCRFVEKKGLYILIKAMQLLPDNYRLTIVGGGPLESEVLSYIEQLSVKNKVILAGYCSSDIIVEKLNKSDAFVLPSITASNGDMEGVPVALMEAMASGLLVFSSFHSGIPELIQHKHSGFLSNEGDSLGLKSNIIHAFEIMDNYQRMDVAKNAREKVSLEFDINKLNVGLINLLSE
jgi:colanic acid/amylovoran biosynthesis glycosyltransferase